MAPDPQIGESDLGYLAGIIDGEGSISIIKDKREGKKGYVFRVGIKMTHEKTILHIKNLFGGSITPFPSKNPNHKDTFLLFWTGHAAQNLLIKIFDKLITKQRQAALFLAFPITYVGGNLSEEEKQLREQIYRVMKESNIRGRI